MDVITAVLQAQVNQVLIFAGIFIVFFTVFNIDLGKKKSIGLRAVDKSTTPIVIIAVLFGAGFILGGLFYPKSHGAVPPEATLAPGITVSTQTPLPLAVASSPTSQAQAPAIIASDTPAPTSAPRIKTLADGCIAAQTWRIASLDTTASSAVSTSNGCLNTEALHISADQSGTLHFAAKAGKDKLASGIYTPIRDNSVIEFSVTVTQLFISFAGDPAATITFALAPQASPMSEQGSSRFKLIVEKPNDIIFYLTAGADQTVGNKIIGQHPEFSTKYSIKMELSGLSVKIYINNANTKEVTLAAGSKVLYIGYSLAPASGADVEISGLKIDGQTP